jgi:Type IV secretion system pilin
MKKIFFSILLAISICMSASIFQTPVYAAGEKIEVRVTEKIPWADCSEPDAKLVVTCQVGKWFSSVMTMMWQMIKYATFIASLGAVLFIVVNGIMYSMSGMDSGLKESAKERIVKTLLGLVVLLLSWVILNAIAPWVYK